jgi:hypothetical protein
MLRGSDHQFWRDPHARIGHYVLGENKDFADTVLEVLGGI